MSGSVWPLESKVWPLKKALCICAQGLVRSPTMAYVLSQHPYNYDTRAAGVDLGALIPVTQQLVNWSDVIFLAQPRHLRLFDLSFKCWNQQQRHVLDLEDPGTYARNPEMEKEIRAKLYSMLCDVRVAKIEK